MYSSTFSRLGTSLTWVVSFTPRPPYSRGNSRRYPLNRRLGGSQRVSRRGGKRKFLTLPGMKLRPLTHPVLSQSLYWLCYLGYLNKNRTVDNFQKRNNYTVERAWLIRWIPVDKWYNSRAGWNPVYTAPMETCCRCLTRLVLGQRQHVL
jgi:hypothetical protein